MKISKVLFREVNIPLRFQFAQSNNHLSHSSSSAIVELHTTEGLVGFGEACPRMYVTGESIRSMEKDLQGISPQLADLRLERMEDWQRQLANWRELGVGPSTLCALELAGIDILCQVNQRSLAEQFSLSDVESPIQYSQVIPMFKPAKMAKLLERIGHLRPASIKLKASQDLEDNMENIRLLRASFGDDTPIRLDVNAGWALDDALEFIPAFLDLGVNSFEQPLALEAHEGLQLLTQRFGQEAQIMVDESLVTIEDAQHFLKYEIGNHFNLKISKLGGILSALQIYRLAEENGIPCQLGAHFGETSLLTTAGIVLTKLAGPISANEGALGEMLLEEDIIQPSVQQDNKGHLAPAAILQQIGFSSGINRDQLASYTVHQRSFQSYRFEGLMRRLSA
ncbi:MAG: hypothetical protein KTR30_01335 [Saprospiraceae bacterium]|nr:hypothetical protein [Saprospiraceae bacterium]